MKNFFKWIFKSNPKTWAMLAAIITAATTAVVTMIEAGMTLEAIITGVLSIGGAILAAHRTGFESNETADERKEKEAK